MSVEDSFTANLGCVSIGLGRVNLACLAVFLSGDAKLLFYYGFVTLYGLFNEAICTVFYDFFLGSCSILSNSCGAVAEADMAAILVVTFCLLGALSSLYELFPSLFMLGN